MKTSKHKSLRRLCWCALPMLLFVAAWRLNSDRPQTCFDALMVAMKNQDEAQIRSLCTNAGFESLWKYTGVRRGQKQEFLDELLYHAKNVNEGFAKYWTVTGFAANFSCRLSGGYGAAPPIYRFTFRRTFNGWKLNDAEFYKPGNAD